MSVAKDELDKLNSCRSGDACTTPLLFSKKMHLLKISSLERLVEEKELIGQTRIDAMLELADRYHHGIGGAKLDSKAASQLFISAAKLGDKYSKAICLQYGYGCEKGDRKAFKLFEELTREGIINIKAEFALGLMYITGGAGIERDNMKAFRLFQNAAKGYAPAQYYLGKCYRDNVCVDENGQPMGKKERDIRALELYRQAEAQKYPLAISGLKDEEMISDLRGVAQNESLKTSGLPPRLNA